jgi:two-component system, OmpR family, sensor kinase
MTAPRADSGEALRPIAPRRGRSLGARMVGIGVAQLVLLGVAGALIYWRTGPRDPVFPDEVVDVAMLERRGDNLEALQRALDDLRGRRVLASIYNAERQLLATNVDPPVAVPRNWRPRRRPAAAGMLPPGTLPPHLALPDPLPTVLPPPEAPVQLPWLPGLPPPSMDPAVLDDGPPPGPPPGERAPGAAARPTARNRPMVAPLQLAGELGVLVARGMQPEPPGWAGPALIIIAGLLIIVLGAGMMARWIVTPINRLAQVARAIGDGDLGARSQLRRSDEIGELGRRVDEMAERIASLLRGEKELFANVAHELRTPLARIGVALDLAGEGDAEAARTALTEIAVDVDELELIVDDILTAMRFEISRGGGAAARLPLRKAHVAPSSILGAAVERQRVRHPERALELAVSDDLPMLEVDPMLVRRVLDNLLENAHKYTPDRAMPTKLVARSDAASVIFEVIDHGIGIDASDLPHVFTAFFRAERSRSRETGGVGLGLTLAKRIIEAHGGVIELTSTSGDGGDRGATTTARVALPYRG